MVHIRVDHHKRFSQLAILTETGEVIERRVPHEGPRIHEAFANLPGPCKIAFESNGCWYWFVDLLEELGHEVVMANPKQVKAIHLLHGHPLKGRSLIVSQPRSGGRGPERKRAGGRRPW